MDLEDGIYVAWQTSQDLDLLYNSFLDMNTDELANVLLGIKAVHDMRMEKLWDLYKREHHLDEYTTDKETLKNRAKLFKTLEEITKPKKSKK